MKSLVSSLRLPEDHGKKIRFYSTDQEKYIIGNLVGIEGEEKSSIWYLVLDSTDGQRKFRVSKYISFEFIKGEGPNRLQLEREEIVLLHRSMPKGSVSYSEELVWKKIEEYLGL